MPADRVTTPTCAVVADTCCDVPSELLALFGVAVCERRPDVDGLVELYRGLLAQGFDGVVSIHKGSEAVAARAAVAKMDDPDRVTVVDVGLTSAALALAVERAAYAACNGGTPAEVAARAEAVADATVLLVISDPSAPRQGHGGLFDRFAYLRRRALGVSHLVRLDRSGYKVLAESDDLANLAGLVAHAFGTRARTDGALCYIEAAGSVPNGLAQLDKPFDTNEYVSYRLATLVPATELVRYSGSGALAVAMIPEDVYGGHETSLFDSNLTV